MELAILRLMIDFALVILILLVQLVIYPAFCQMSASNLKRWHPIYTQRITVVVLPLMLSQLVLMSYMVWKDFTYPNLASFLIVTALWALTFLQAVPLHQKIEQDEDPLSAAHELVSANRIRTFLWIVVFLLGYFNLR